MFRVVILGTTSVLCEPAACGPQGQSIEQTVDSSQNSLLVCEKAPLRIYTDDTNQRTRYPLTFTIFIAAIFLPPSSWLWQLPLFYVNRIKYHQLFCQLGLILKFWGFRVWIYFSVGFSGFLFFSEARFFWCFRNAIKAWRRKIFSQKTFEHIVSILHVHV